MYCECGCGQKTPIALRNDPRGKYKKGDPARYIRGHQSRKNTPQYRVDENGCWMWLWVRDAKGYGQVRRGKAMVRAHKVYWEREHGPVPDGLQLDHLCRNRACVNPEHLEPVTNMENGQRGARAKLSQAAAERIRERHSLGESKRALAREYEVDRHTILRVVLGQCWPVAN